MSSYNLDIIVKAIDKASVPLKGVNTSLRSLAGASKDIRPAGEALAAVGVAGAALLTSSMMVAARVEVLGLVLATVGRNAGYSELEIARFETGVQDLGITTQASRQALVQMAQANIDFSHATNLATLAQDAAVIAQIDSSEAFTRLITVVQRGSPVMARTMGLTVDFQGAYERLADELGITTLELDANQKMQARLGEVMAQGTSIAGTYEAAMGSVGKSMLSLNRHWEEARVAIGDVWLPAMTSAVDVTTDALKAFNALPPSQQKAASGFIGVTTAVAGASGGLILLAPRIVSTVDAFRTLGTMTGFTGSAFAGMVGPLAAAAAGFTAFYIASDKLADAADVIREVPPEIDTLTAASMLLDTTTQHTQAEMDAMAASIIAQEEALAGLTQGYYNDMAAMGEAGGAVSSLADGWGASMGRMAEGTGAASGAIGGLQEAIAGITVADKVLELDTGALAAYNLAAAMGATDQALVELGVQLGLFTEAEANATRATQEAAAQFAATGDVEAYRTSIVGVTTALIADKVALAEAAGGLEHARGGMQEGAVAADGFRGSLDRAAGGLDAVESGARNVAAAIQSIPTSWSINVNTHYSQSGVPPTAGGEAWVPGGGGAMPGMQHGAWNVPSTGPRVIHQGEMVIPAGPAEKMRQGEIGGTGNKTIVLAPIIIDSMQAHDATGAIMFEALAEMIQSQAGGIM